MSVRFAPSPTGDFHIGNLRTAFLSHEWAKRLKMPWVVRVEDIDKPRNVPGAMERQLDDLKTLGMIPDLLQIQSHRYQRHWEVFEKFRQAQWIYPCLCSRQTIRQSLSRIASAPHEPAPSYDGHCRHIRAVPKTTNPTIAWRLQFPDESGKDDLIIARTAPDGTGFVPAYHLACTIDDYDGEYVLLVRASDLREATKQQRYVFQKLAESEGKKIDPPAVFHCSLVTATDGTRLEKRTRGVTLDELLKAGETPESLCQKFLKSFSGNWNAFSPHHLFGEARPTLPTSEL